MPDENVEAPTLWPQSGVNSKGEPFVEFLLHGKVVGRMDVPQTRDHAMVILETAAAAEQEAFFFDWVTEEFGKTPEAAGRALASFQKFHRCWVR